VSSLRRRVPASARRHVFRSNFCRRRAERWDGPTPDDREQVVRLFDESRDPNERIRDDDWHPTPERLKWR